LSQRPTNRQLRGGGRGNCLGPKRQFNAWGKKNEKGPNELLLQKISLDLLARYSKNPTTNAQRNNKGGLSRGNVWIDTQWKIAGRKGAQDSEKEKTLSGSNKTRCREEIQMGRDAQRAYIKQEEEEREDEDEFGAQSRTKTILSGR